MRIVFVGNGTHSSDDYPAPRQGGSVQTWFLSKEFAERGHEVCIIRRSSVREIVVDDVGLLGIDFNGLDSLNLPFWSYLFIIGSLVSKIYFSKKSLEMIQKIKPDVVYLTDRFTAIFPSYLNLPKVFIMHVPEALDFFKPYAIHANKFNSIMFYVKKITESKVLRNVDRIITLNSFIERYLRVKGYSNVSKIPNGIDIESFSNKGDENFILYAGRFDWNKNVSSLVNTFAEVHSLHPDYNLYLVGEGPEEKRIRTLVMENGIQSYVKIIPWLPRKKLMDLMSRCSIFVLPSFFETFGGVVIEAMASAKPVIARANMGTMDIIVNGENGHLYNNDGELRKYLETLLSDDSLRKKMGHNARRTVEQKYTFSRIADRHEELFYTLKE